MSRLTRPDRGRRRGAPRGPVTIPDFVPEIRSILPPNSQLAQEHGDVLRACEVFEAAHKYLLRIEPALDLAYSRHLAMRATPSSAAICDAIERYTDHGRAFVAGQYTFVHYLEDHDVPPALFRDAQAAFVREVKEGTRAAFASLSERSKRPPSLAQATPTASSSLQWPITAPLSEPAFNELREIVRDGIAVMYQGCDVLAEIYQGKPLPPDIQKVWHDAFDRAQQCGPLLDGTFTHADHMRALGAHSSS